MYQVQGCQAEHDGLIKSGQEHPNETNRRKVIHSTNILLVIFNGNAEQIPIDRLSFIITSLWVCRPLINDIVLANAHFIGIYCNTILIVLLILIQRVVLIDIFDIRRCFVSRSIIFLRAFRIGRVAVWIIDILIAFKNILFSTVVIRTAEIMIPVSGRISCYRIINCSRHNATNCLQVVLISRIRFFFFRGQPI